MAQLDIGLNTQTFRDTAWHTLMDSGFTDAETRLTLNGTDEPQGNVTCHWVGQKYYKTDTLETYIGTVSGADPASSTWIKQPIIKSGAAEAGPSIVAGEYVGQQYFETQRNTMWTCTGAGDAGVATWVQNIPQGTVTMWAGDPTAIPAGWWLCDGTTASDGSAYETPNLRGQFIVGYDDGDADYDGTDPVGVPQSGGAKVHEIVAANLPNHTHNITTTSNQQGHSAAEGFGNTGNLFGTPEHIKPTLSSGGQADPDDIDHRPNWYVLAYIAKT